MDVSRLTGDSEEGLFERWSALQASAPAHNGGHSHTRVRIKEPSDNESSFQPVDPAPPYPDGIAEVGGIPNAVSPYRRAKHSLLKKSDITSMPDESLPRVLINVSGQKFELLYSQIRRYPKTRLARVVAERQESYTQRIRNELGIMDSDESISPKMEIFFARDPAIFGAIANFYMTGHLHLDANWCGSSIKNELQFWQISLRQISSCCHHIMNNFDEAEARKEWMNQMFTVDSTIQLIKGDDKWSRARRHIWRFLDDASSKGGQIWTGVRLFVTIISVSIYVLSTTTVTRYPTTRQHNISQETQDEWYDNNYKRWMYTFTHQYKSMHYVDYVCTFFFTAELIARILLAPSKKHFFKNGLNIIDIICLTGDWFIYVTRRFWKIKIPAGKYIYGWIFSLKVLRVFRIFKASSKYGGLRVLVLSMKASIPELILMTIIMGISLITYSILIYNAEFSNEGAFITIPSCSWWALITITTVGYGDVYPITPQGKVIGSVTAITGIIFLSLLIPIISARFTEFYEFADRAKKEEEDRTSDEVIEELTPNGQMETSLVMQNYMTIQK